MIPGGDHGAIMVMVHPAVEHDPDAAAAIRRMAAEKAASLGGQLAAGQPAAREVIPAHDSDEGPVPEMVRLTFTMVRL